MSLSDAGPWLREPTIGNIGRRRPRLFHRERVVRRNRRIVLIIGAAFAGLMFAGLGHSAQPTQVQAERLAPPVPDDAETFVRQLGDRVIGLLNRPGVTPAERSQGLKQIFQEVFDVDGMAQFAAGRYWRTAKPAIRRNYVDLFGNYVAALYAARFAAYSGESFVVEGQRGVAEDVAAVHASIVYRDKKPTRLDFRVRRGGAGFRISDVYVEGLSLLITKRDEFNAILSSGGMDRLVDKLRQLARS